MAISYVGGVQGGRAGATSTTTQSLSGTLTGGSNTSPSAGDLVVVWCASGADTTAAAAQSISGNNNGAYTALTEQSSVVATTYDTYSKLSYKIQGSTVDTSLTIPSSGSARNAQRWIVHVFRNVDSTTPMDVTATYATGTGTGRPNPASITPTTSGAWICAFYASAAATGTAYTAPTDFSTNWLGGTTADTADCMAGGGYYTGWTSGSYDPAAITAGGTTNAAHTWTATTIALRPVATDYPATPGVASLALTAQTPTVLLATIVPLASPTALSLTAQAPTVKIGTNITTASPSSLSINAQAPTVAYTDNKSITLSTPSVLSLSPQAPTVTATDNKAITLATPTVLTTTAYAPTVLATDNKQITLSTASLTLTAQIPTVEFTNISGVDIILSTASLILTPQSPTVTATDNKSISLSTPTSLSLTPQAPAVEFTDNKEITPGVAAMLLAMFAPTVEVTNNIIVTPGTLNLTLTPRSPIVNDAAPEDKIYIDFDGNIYQIIKPTLYLDEQLSPYYVINSDLGILEKV